MTTLLDMKRSATSNVQSLEVGPTIRRTGFKLPDLRKSLGAIEAFGFSLSIIAPTVTIGTLALILVSIGVTGAQAIQERTTLSWT